MQVQDVSSCFFRSENEGKSNLIAITEDRYLGEKRKLLKSKEMMYKIAAVLRGQRFDDL